MARKFTLICFLVLSFFPNLFARELKPLDAFIERVKTTNQFVPISDIWHVDNNFDQRDLLKNVERVQPMSIDYTRVAALMEKKNMAINLTIPGINGGSYTLELARYDYFTNDFTVVEHGVSGIEKKVEYTPGLYYSGVVKGIEGSFAVFSFFKNEVYGIFSIPGVAGNYVLVPNTMVGKEYDYNANYILYNDVDIKFKNKAPKCGTEDFPRFDSKFSAAKTTTTLNNNIYNNCTYVRCYEVADYKLYQSKGSNTTTTTNYLTSIFNVKATLYRNEGVPIVMKKIQINSAPDPYVGLPTAGQPAVQYWVHKFAWVVQDDIHSVHNCDVGSLYTRQSGGMGGVASNIAVTCTYYDPADSTGPFCFLNLQNDITSFPTYSWDAGSSAHEMGHTLGSRHTHACVWNPPFTGTTAIDGCYTQEGSCADPGNPSSSVGGTIMSYCHLTSSGVNFSNGFGTQPGNVIRTFLDYYFSPTSCGAVYTPTVTITKPNRTKTANRQCTDISGTDTTTYYWADNNTASVDDDTLVLAVRAHGNNFGTLNTSGLSISMTTLGAYGSNVGQAVTFPSGMTSLRPNKRAFNRYWKVTGATATTGLLEVMYPFSGTDSSDVDGSIPGITRIRDFRMYKVITTVDPNPATGFASVPVANISIFNYSAGGPSTTQWYQSTTPSGTRFAHMKMKDINGGGTGFYDYTVAAVALSEVNGGTTLTIYPNPTDNEWQVEVGNVNGLTFRLYAADGRLVISRELTAGANAVSAADLAQGIYFYRVVGDDKTFTGSLMKN